MGGFIGGAVRVLAILQSSPIFSKYVRLDILLLYM